MQSQGRSIKKSKFNRIHKNPFRDLPTGLLSLHNRVTSLKCSKEFKTLIFYLRIQTIHEHKCTDYWSPLVTDVFGPKQSSDQFWPTFSWTNNLLNEHPLLINRSISFFSFYFHVNLSLNYFNIFEFF